VGGPLILHLLAHRGGQQKTEFLGEKNDSVNGRRQFLFSYLSPALEEVSIHIFIHTGGLLSHEEDKVLTYTTM
jgi:hypothetical protein